MTQTEADIWKVLNNDKQLIEYCQSNINIDNFLEYHPTFRINIIQWCLWYIGSGVRSFSHVKFGEHSRKEWAFHKIDILHKYLPKNIWKELVHSSTGFSNKCKTYHYFTRNAYTVEPCHLDKINEWFDEVNGRFLYTHVKDEYGYTPVNYVEFHRKRQEIFRKKIKPKADVLVQKYHVLEENLKECEGFDSIVEYHDGIRKLSYQKYVENNLDKRKKIVEIIKLRIEAHLLHHNLFNDELSEIEKKEEECNRGLSQTSNHKWIIKAYISLLEGTPEEKRINLYLNFKKITIYNDTIN